MTYNNVFSSGQILSDCNQIQILSQPFFMFAKKISVCTFIVLVLSVSTSFYCLDLENIEKLKCSTCSATFRTSRMLRLHIYKNHTENSQYSCQTCSQDFYDLKKFVLHQIKYHAERNGDHIYCLACRRPYTKSHSLQVLLTHYSKSQIFVQKFNFDKTPTFSRVFHPKIFWQFFS